MKLEKECELRCLTLNNERGLRIVGLLSAPTAEPRGTVVIAPGYENRIHHYSVLSRYLVRHGYTTVRFDLTDHVGMSEGDIFDYSLSGMVGDIRAVLAEGEGQAPRFVVAPSMAARASVRALARGAVCQGLVMPVPVVDLRYTWSQALDMDPLGLWERREVRDPRTPCRVLKHDIAYACAQDALESGLHDLDGTISDIAAVECPVTAIALERDDWVRISDVRVALGEEMTWPRRVVTLDASSHDISHNPPVMRLMMASVLDALSAFDGAAAPAVEHLSFDELVETVTREKHMARTDYADLHALEAR